MSHEPPRHGIIVALWRLDGCDDAGVNNLHAKQLLVVVPGLVVHHLPQQLYGSLGANTILFRQIDIINKDNEILTTENKYLAFFEIHLVS